MHTNVYAHGWVFIMTSHVLCKHSNGERASIANLKMTIGSLLACS